jgi:hypothetical protein
LIIEGPRIISGLPSDEIAPHSTAQSRKVALKILADHQYRHGGNKRAHRHQLDQHFSRLGAFDITLDDFQRG